MVVGGDRIGWMTGITVTFQVGIDEVIYWFSCWTGRYRILVNDREVLAGANLRLSSRHDFELGSACMTIVLEVGLGGQHMATCTLERNGIAVARKALARPGDQGHPVIWLAALVGGVATALVAWYAEFIGLGMLLAIVTPVVFITMLMSFLSGFALVELPPEERLPGDPDQTCNSRASR